MTALTMGGNAPLPGEDFEVTVRWKTANAVIEEIDVSAFLLTATGKVASDDDMVFYGQKSDKSGGVRLVETKRASSGGAFEASIDFDLRRLPQAVEKIAITGTIMDAQKKRASFSDVSSLVVSLIRAGGTAASGFSSAMRFRFSTASACHRLARATAALSIRKAPL